MKKFSLILLLVTGMTWGQDIQPLTISGIQELSANFQQDPGRVAIQNALANNPINDLAIDRQTRIKQQHLFSDLIDVEGISNQKSSGRCWMFAGMNILRPDVIDRYNLEAFEFSHNYLFFYDKLEKANLFLNQMILMRERDIHDRELEFLLDSPIGDGGQWNMVVDLVEKYGVVPMEAMPETHASSSTGQLNKLLKKRLRKGAAEIRKAGNEAQRKLAYESGMQDVYRLLALALGEPPAQFVWQYENKKGKLSKARSYTPKEFASEVVKQELADYVYLLQNPTKAYFQTYEISLDRDMIEKPDMSVLNIPMDAMKTQTMKAVLAGYPIWFACDVGQEQLKSDGLMVRGIYDYEALTGVDVNLSKEDQILYGESIPTHAMVFVGVDVVGGEPRQWKVENSWGTDKGREGYWLMDDAWFDQYMYGVILPRKFLDDKTLQALDTDPVVLPPWDAMYDMIRGPR